MKFYPVNKASIINIIGVISWFAIFALFAIKGQITLGKDFNVLPLAVLFVYGLWWVFVLINYQIPTIYLDHSGIYLEKTFLGTPFHSRKVADFAGMSIELKQNEIRFYPLKKFGKLFRRYSLIVVNENMASFFQRHRNFRLNEYGAFVKEVFRRVTYAKISGKTYDLAHKLGIDIGVNIDVAGKTKDVVSEAQIFMNEYLEPKPPGYKSQKGSESWEEETGNRPGDDTKG